MISSGNFNQNISPNTQQQVLSADSDINTTAPKSTAAQKMAVPVNDIKSVNNMPPPVIKEDFQQNKMVDERFSNHHKDQPIITIKSPANVITDELAKSDNGIAMKNELVALLKEAGRDDFAPIIRTDIKTRLNNFIMKQAAGIFAVWLTDENCRPEKQLAALAEALEQHLAENHDKQSILSMVAKNFTNVFIRQKNDRKALLTFLNSDKISQLISTSQDDQAPTALVGDLLRELKKQTTAVYLETLTQQEQATRKNIFSAALDFETPAFSTWQNFLRGLKNFFKTIISLGYATTYTLNEEAVLNKARQFAANNDVLLLELYYSGYSYSDVMAAILWELKDPAFNNLVDKLLLADNISTIFQQAALDCQKNKFKDFTNLPAEDIRSKIISLPMKKLGTVLPADPATGKSFNFTAFNHDEINNLQEKLLSYFSQYPTGPDNPEKMARLLDILQTAKLVNHNRLQQLVTPQPDKITTGKERVDFIINQLFTGLPESNKLLTVLQQLDNIEIVPEYLSETLESLSNEQLTALVEMIQSAGFRDFQQGIATSSRDLQNSDRLTDRLLAKQLGQISYRLQAIKTAIRQKAAEHFLPGSGQTAEAASEQLDLLPDLQNIFSSQQEQMRVGISETLTAQGQIIINRLAIGGSFSPAAFNQALDHYLSLAKLDDYESQLEIIATDFEQNLGGIIRSLSGEQLLKLSKGLNSLHMVGYRLSLQNSINKFNILRKEQKESEIDIDPVLTAEEQKLNLLNSLAATIETEIIERSYNNDKKEGQLTGVQTAIIAGTARRNFKDDLDIQSNDFLKGQKDAEITEDPKMVNTLHDMNITKEEFSQLVNRTELTINVPLYLFCDVTDNMDEDVHYKHILDINKGNTQLTNIFGINKDKGTNYRPKRLDVEHRQFPELQKFDRQSAKIDPKAHPISSALNFANNAQGAAPMYSDGMPNCIVVLKDDVKERTTYTPLDSFKSFTQQVTPEGLVKFRQALEQFANNNDKLDIDPKYRQQITPEIIDKLINGAPKVLTDRYGMGERSEFTVAPLLKTIEELKDCDGTLRIALQDISEKAFTIDKFPKVATFDKLEKLLPHTNPFIRGAIKKTNVDPGMINAKVSGYIEGQIWGGVDILKDVKEIRVEADELTPEQETQLKEYEKHGIKIIKFFKADLDTHTKSVPLAVTKVPQNITTPTGFKYFKENELSEILEIYKNHELTFDPQGIHGRGHICRVLIYANVMSNFLKEKGLTIDTYGLFRALAFHDSGRTKNGHDTEEDKSAGKLKDFLIKKHPGPDAEVTAYINKTAAAITTPIKDVDDPDEGVYTIEKNYPLQINENSPSLEGMILQSADSLDIVRVHGLKKFDKSRLAFGSHSYLLPKFPDQKSNFIDMRDKEIIDFRDEILREALLLNQFEDSYTQAYNTYIQENEKLLNNENMDSKEKNDRRDQLLNQLHESAGQIDNLNYFECFTAHIKDRPNDFPLFNKFFKE